MGKELENMHFSSNNYGDFIVYKYQKGKGYIIKFNDGTLVYNVTKNKILRGDVRNHNFPAMYGVGFIGKGKYTSKHKSFLLWQGVLQRCYHEKAQEKYPTYKGVTVCEEWHNFQNFAKWYEHHHTSCMEHWDIDKDILCPECKVYSPETCTFVPRIINTFYRTAFSSDGLPKNISKVGKKYKVIFKHREEVFYIGTFDLLDKAIEECGIGRSKIIKKLAEEYKECLCYEIYKKLTL